MFGKKKEIKPKIEFGKKQKKEEDIFNDLPDLPPQDTEYPPIESIMGQSNNEEKQPKVIASVDIIISEIVTSIRVQNDLLAKIAAILETNNAKLDAIGFLLQQAMK